MTGRAGVFVSEANFLSYQAAPPGNAVAAFIGQHYRGPVNVATFVGSWPDFVQKFGGFDGVTAPSPLQLAVYTFFQNGGTGAWCVRATGTAAAASTATFVDTTPANTIALSAKNPGAWGNNISVTIQNGVPLSLPSTTLNVVTGGTPQTLPASGGNFTLVSTAGLAPSGSIQLPTTANGMQTITYASITNGTTIGGVTGGTGTVPASSTGSQVQTPTLPTFNLIVYYGGTTGNSIVETWTGLTMSPSSSQYFLSVLNSTTSGSNWIVAALAGSSPGTMPVAIGPVSLAGGADGNAIASGGYTTANAPNGNAANGFLNALDAIRGPLVLNLPGVAPSGGVATDVNNAIGYAAGRQDIFVVVDPPSTAASASSGASVTALTGSNILGAISPSSAGLSVDPMSYAAMYVPWLNIADPASSNPGSTRLVPPGGAVCGAMLKTDTVRGVFKAPAGLQASVQGAVGLEWRYSNTDLDNLYSGNAGAASPSPSLNPIRFIPGSGLVIWGARTLSSNIIVRTVSVRRTLIYVRNQALSLTTFAPFEPNDGILWNNISAVLSQFLGGFWQSGGLKGTSVAEAYFIVCDETNNTPTTIANGEVHVDIGVAVQRPAEFVLIRLGQWQGGQTAVLAA